MKRLQFKIFLLAAALSVSASLATLYLLRSDAIGVRSVAILLTIVATTAFGASYFVSRVVLSPLDQIRRLSSEISGGRRDHRLHWSYGDERDATATALNHMSDRLSHEIEEARREAQQLEAVMAGMVEGVLVLDPQNRILLVNPGLRELFGIWGSVRGRTVLEVIRLPEIDNLLRKARDGIEPVIRDIPLRTGSKRTVLAHAARFPAEGPPAGTLAVFHDVTEIRRVDQVRRDFIANASHELRTPLTSIQGFAETLSTASLSPEDEERCQQTILRNVSRMRDLIDDLMNLSRIENEDHVLERSRVDVVRLARELIADHQKHLLSTEIDARLMTSMAPEAWCDRGALLQVLENLLTNAIRYTDAGGQIQISVEAREQTVEVIVADTGIGIPEEARTRIFERFYRVDAARSRAVGSTGLGLAIVRHLVQAMEGTISVESEIGIGSRFTLALPRVADALHQPGSGQSSDIKG